MQAHVIPSMTVDSVSAVKIWLWFGQLSLRASHACTAKCMVVHYMDSLQPGCTATGNSAFAEHWSEQGSACTVQVLLPRSSTAYTNSKGTASQQSIGRHFNILLVLVVVIART